MDLVYDPPFGLKEYSGKPLPYDLAKDYVQLMVSGVPPDPVVTVHEKKGTAPRDYPPYVVRLELQKLVSNTHCESYAAVLGCLAYYAPLQAL